MCSWNETNIVSGRKNSMSGIRTQEVHRMSLEDIKCLLCVTYW